jgi:hypothetical protein
MGMEDINNAAGAQNALTARVNAFLDSIDADIATRQAAYAALAADLVGIVKTQMSKSYFVSPNGSDANDGLSRDTPFATIDRVFDYAPKGSTVDIYIESSEAQPFVVTISNVDDRSVTFRPFNNGDTCYLKWRGVLTVNSGTVDFIYTFRIEYDANEYDGYLFNATQMASISMGGHDSTHITLKNTTDFRFVNSVYAVGGFSSVYLARVSLFDEVGDPYAGVTTIFHRGTSSGFAAYELWQCSLGPNFVHAGTSIGSNSYIVG